MVVGGEDFARGGAPGGRGGAGGGGTPGGGGDGGGGEVRGRLALALDLDDLPAAVALASAVSPWFGVAKVGLELFGAAGPAAVVALRDAGLSVFLDLKLHDIPTTVGKAARVLSRLGASYVTVHAAGGQDMLRAAVDGFGAGASGGARTPVVLAVTVLTSDPLALPAVVAERVDLAASTGCGGVVCSPHEAAAVRLRQPGLQIVTPGIRPAGSASHDQARAATPAHAIRAGADLLVVGRAVTQAADPAAAAAAVAAEVAAACS
jgi:orotidine-5'-phosphate decarboxylase